MARVRGRVVPDVTFGAQVEGIGWVDHAWIEGGLPTCHWNGAPGGLATRRQLRELGLAPGGHEPVAALRRRPAGYLHAWLYRLDLAVRKRTATPAVLAALGEAMRARRTCPTCGTDTGACLPRSLGECWDCYLAAPARVRAAHDHDDRPSTETAMSGGMSGDQDRRGHSPPTNPVPAPSPVALPARTPTGPGSPTPTTSEGPTMLQTQTCVTAHCDQCGHRPFDHDQRYWPTEDAALDTLTAEGWQAGGAGLRCPDCVALAACEADGHDFGEWIACRCVVPAAHLGHRHGPDRRCERRYRYCDRCDLAETTTTAVAASDEAVAS